MARASVITIFRDPGEFFQGSIDSVLAQTHEDLELLLVDDGSTDGSSEVARDVAARHPDRVRYLEHPGHANRGMGAARALGLAHATGEFIATLDADDAWPTDALARQIAALEADPDAAAVFGSTLYWRSWDPDSPSPDSIYHLGPTGRLQPPVAAIDLVARRGLESPSMNAVVVRADVVRAVGGYVEEFTGLFEDQAFLFKLLLEHPVVVHRQVIDRYRQHEGSATAEGMRSGIDAPRRPSEARDRFLRFTRDHLERRLAAHDPGSPLHAAAAGGSLLDEFDRAVARAPASTYGRVRSKLDRLRTRGVRRVSRQVGSPLARVLPRRPASTKYGFDRGTPVDRTYIERFLEIHAGDVRGHALEIGDPAYLRRFGGSKVERIDVLHIAPGHPETTIVGDLSDAPHIPSDTFDCIVFTQTLHLIYDVPATLATLHRILRPGGVLLMTVPGLSPMTDEQGWGHFWMFTPRSIRRLLAERFDEGEVVVDVHGNATAAAAFIYGYAAEEVGPRTLHRVDGRYPVIVTARARKV